MDEKGQPLTPSIVAQRLGVHRKRVYEYIEEGLLRAHNRSPGKQRPTWVIYEDDLDDFNETHVSPATGEKTTPSHSQSGTEAPKEGQATQRNMGQKVTEGFACP